MTSEQLQRLISAGDVRRLHGTPHHQPCTVGRHSWGMAVLLYQLYPYPGPPPHMLVRACLEHDAPELLTGDIPRSAKERWPSLNTASARAEDDAAQELGVWAIRLDDEEQHWLNALDVLELYLYCFSEEKLGNRHVAPIAARCQEILSESWVPAPVQAVALDLRQVVLPL
jgi:5'-deoxynucleotidase YfbR-like HD superfamily hydrolase